MFDKLITAFFFIASSLLLAINVDAAPTSVNVQNQSSEVIFKD